MRQPPTRLFSLLALPLLMVACNAEPSATQPSSPPATMPATEPDGTVKLTDAQWRERLTPQQYNVLREAGTERPGTGALLNNKEEGVYLCAACGQELFESDTKFESGTGWPSFYQPVGEGNVEERSDYGRTEVVCSRCGGHLGHVFNDGPRPTGERFCINSAALAFRPADDAAATQPAATQPAATQPAE